MATRGWLGLAVLMLALGLLIGSPLLISAAGLMAALVGAAHFWRARALDGVEYRRRWHYRRGFPGETTQVQIEVENNKLLPISMLRTRDLWSQAVAPEDETLLKPSHIKNVGTLMHLFSLRWYEKTARSYPIRFRERGVYGVGPLTLEAGDPFGLLRQETRIEDQEYLTVYPEILPGLQMRLRAEDPFGEQKAPRPIFEDPNRPMGVRDYRPEDGFRRVHWNATARTGSLQVKVYQPVSSQVQTLCLNVSTVPHYWEGVIPPLLEMLVKVACTLAVEGVQRGYSVGMISNGCLAHADRPFRVPPGRSPQQLTRLLSALAAVSPFTTAPFEHFLWKSMPNIPYGSSLTIITALVTPELCEVLMRLKRYRPHTTLVSLASTLPPALPGVQVMHLPYSPEDAG